MFMLKIWTNYKTGHSSGSMLFPQLFYLMSLVFISHLAYGDENIRTDPNHVHFELEEVVVTANGLQKKVENTSKNITVITSDEIEQAPSNNVVDLLSREANVNLQSLFGHDKNAGVDIRGQGSTSGSNVLILVDGFRLNPPDLSGPDLSSIPMNQIERIEIMRGAGSVLYGDGAVGGVINIITKKKVGKIGQSVAASFGSFDTLGSKVSADGRGDRFYYDLNAGYSSTDGYRDNGYYRRSDISGRIGYDLLNMTSMSLFAAYKNDSQGFPGGVPKKDINNRYRRRLSRSPDDYFEGDEMRLFGNAETKIQRLGHFNLNMGYRSRQSDFILGFTPLKTKEQQKNQIDEKTATTDLVYKNKYTVSGEKQVFQLGVNLLYTDYVTERKDQLIRKNSRSKSMGIFALNEGSVSKKLSYNFGGRVNRYTGKFRNDNLKNFGAGVKRWINGDLFKRNWNNTAFDSGIVYSLNEKTNLFFSFANSFRVPNVDELAMAVDNLKPQDGRHMDVGMRRDIGDFGEMSLTLFRVVTKNEIYFDSLNNINKNYKHDTLRHGMELESKFYPTEKLYVWGNCTFMKAMFDQGNKSVPLVPKITASFGLEWNIFDSLLMALTGSYVGSKFDGNDINNDQFEKINDYTVVDGKLTLTLANTRLFLGINNIFDTLYETTAFSETYYTMPTRTFYGGIQWTR